MVNEALAVLIDACQAELDLLLEEGNKASGRPVLAPGMLPDAQELRIRRLTSAIHTGLLALRKEIEEGRWPR